MAKRGRAVGQCFYPENSKDKSIEIFISPLKSDSIDVAAILIHEICHAVLPKDAGHGSDFRRVAKKMGLTGKMTATVASDELIESLKILFKRFPKYPHKDMVAMETLKKDGIRMLKAVCSDCGYTVRLTRKWIEFGLPTCPCGNEMEQE